MRRSIEIEKTTKKKIITDKAVTDATATDDVLERALQTRKRVLQPLDKLGTRMPTATRNARKQPANGQKLFLHRSVSRWRPSAALIAYWYSRVLAGPALVMGECRVTLMQPRTKRPAYSFLNPRKKRDKRYSVNDSISYCAVVLMANGQYPNNEYDEVSHVCGQRRCVNVEHLRWEALNVNAERMLCHHYGNECNHVPKCLSVTANDMNRAKNALKRMI